MGEPRWSRTCPRLAARRAESAEGRGFIFACQSRNRVPDGRYAGRNDGCSRANQRQDVMKVLVIASELISADRLRSALGEAADDAEIMGVAPGLHRSALPFWPSNADEANQRAELVQRETVQG